MADKFILNQREHTLLQQCGKYRLFKVVDCNTSKEHYEVVILSEGNRYPDEGSNQRKQFLFLLTASRFYAFVTKRYRDENKCK